MTVGTNILSGTYTQVESISASARRTIHTFEVLDYDTYRENYALIYKDIVISHQQTQTTEKANTPYSGMVYLQFLYQNGELPASALLLHNLSDVFTSIGTRIVTYKLHYKIGSVAWSVDLATCTISNNVQAYTASGQRIYGVSMQVSEKYIAYSFEKQLCVFDGFLGVGTQYNYDGPINLEDWNLNQLNIPVWERSKQVVGLINIADKKSDVGYLKQEEYDVLNQQQYAVGIVTK